MPEITSLVATAGTTTSLFVSGAIFAFSAGGVNTSKLATKTSPVLAAQQWLNVFNRCHKIGTPMVIFSAGCFAWLKYQTNNNIYLAASASCMCIVPYTILFLSGPEKILFPAANMKQKTLSTPEPREIERALSQWEVANIVRILFPLVGGVMVLVSKM
ncbi:hypothetical protein Asppvi_009374 [Aspergillus pseudoviridinutans]|uniref:DUF1772-domain-containing protein n=1 Tax=Aspergillus pseudoviridinutans TaxID=1517512 RepID=A0A9P3BJG1_9EURO|nr:uncharacterized protein Asppvi_009374 [Aspergillus pseudoviridinutans]GIJ90420.1 hypothetical protein Asppvi_009374 [Aspergillus pseudoviridinutans]